MLCAIGHNKIASIGIESKIRDALKVYSVSFSSGLTSVCRDGLADNMNVSLGSGE